MVVDRDLWLVWVNQPFEVLLGRPPGTLVGRSLGEITHADDVDIGLDLIRRAFDGGLGRYQLVKRYLRVDGSPVTVKVEVVVHEDPKLGPLAVGTVRPISPSTAQPVDVADVVVRQVREEQRTLALVHEAGLVADAASTRAELLEGTLRVLCTGTGSAFAIAHDCRGEGQPVVEAEVRIDDESRVEAVQRCLCLPSRGGLLVGRVRDARRVLVDDGEAVVPTRTDNPCVTRWVGIPIRSGPRITGVIELFATSPIDVGDGLAAALNDVGAHLGRALERLELEAKAIELAAAERSFAATATHELRNPVAAAALALSTMARHGERLGADDRDALFAVVERSLAQLGGLVTGLGELARSEGAGGSEALVDAELAPLIVGAIGDLELLFGRHVAVDVPGGISVRCAPVAVTEIVGNLVTNAVRHGGPTITVTARVDGAGAVRVEVVDDGPGIPAAVEARLFEPFVRAGHGSEGLGLGLTISRHLALAMGGTLTHEVVEPHGACFVLTLPEAT